MPQARTALLVALGLLGIIYACLLFARVRAATRARRANGPVPHPAELAGAPSPSHLAVGLLTNFFDSLGIGSFAPTTSVFKLFRMVPDELIPGTLNVGHTLPAVVQAFVFITIVQVDVGTLGPMIFAAVLGAWLGADVVAGWPRQKVRVGMGVALLAAAILMLMTNLDLFPAGGNAIGLEGARLGIGIASNFVLGALMTLGIGLYAPCMIVVSLLGMNPITAFPIMMGSCAFLMPVGSIRFMRRRRFSLRPALGLLIGGIPGVLVGALVVKSLPLTAIRWLVVAVVVYTAAAMLRAAAHDRAPSGSEAAHTTPERALTGTD